MRPGGMETLSPLMEGPDPNASECGGEPLPLIPLRSLLVLVLPTVPRTQLQLSHR
nr:uncharacterized protein LOC109149606 [Ipomoea batatas]